MVHVLVIGAAGMLGGRLAARVARAGAIGGRRVTRLTLADAVEPPPPTGDADPGVSRITTLATDIADRHAASRLAALRPDIIVHLAAIVSGEAEADFDKGYAVNLDGTRHLLEAIRAGGSAPRLVFASSLAVYGPPFPDRVPDDFPPAPQTSYGTQKAMVELLIADYSRRGFVDGVALRLPTLVVRPGKPNRAASSFFSAIIREPLHGQVAVLPVPTSVRHWLASPRAAVGFFEHAATMDTGALGARRSLNMPGLSATVQDEIDALRELAGQQRVDLIRYQPDPSIAAIIDGWPRDFDARRARELGFRADDSFAAIVRTYAEEEGIRL